MRFRKRPVEIDAVRWTGANFDEVAAFVGADLDDEAEVARAMAKSDGRLRIRTLEGVLTASAGDWIIRGVEGEHYSCKPRIFEATYEEAR